ncbi:MAG: tetratricopeptide repeat protein [Gemmatimonadales bacterium]|nr:MAG: tetratricopeptide repeat protein [Gemmatimonadales bacterium]
MISRQSWSRLRHTVMSAGVAAALLVLGPHGELRGQDAADPPGPSIPALEEEARRLDRSSPGVEAGRAWQALGMAYRRVERRPEAVGALARAIVHFETRGEPGEVAEARLQRGMTYWALAEYESALLDLEESRRIWTELGDARSIGRAWNNLGVVHYQRGNYELALEAYLQSLQFRQDAGDGQGEAIVLANIGLTYQDWGQYETARDAVARSISLADAHAEPWVRGYVRQIQGRILLTLGELDAAEESFSAALPFYDEDQQWETLAGLSMVHIRRGRPELAIPILEGILEGALDVGQPRREARAHLHLGEASRAAGRPDEALVHLEAGLDVARRWEQRTLALSFLSELAEVHEARGAPVEALAALRAHEALRDSIFSQGTGQQIVAMQTRIETERQERENLRLVEEQLVQAAVIRRQQLMVALGAGILSIAAILVGLLALVNREGRRREAELADANSALAFTNEELRQALSEVKALKGLIPICAHCKKVRDDRGYWEAVETYISERSEALFSHSICAECGPVVYGQDWGPELSEPMEPLEPVDPSERAETSEVVGGLPVEVSARE